MKIRLLKGKGSLDIPLGSFLTVSATRDLLRLQSKPPGPVDLPATRIPSFILYTSPSCCIYWFTPLFHQGRSKRAYRLVSFCFYGLMLFFDLSQTEITGLRLIRPTVRLQNNCGGWSSSLSFVLNKILKQSSQQIWGSPHRNHS